MENNLQKMGCKFGSANLSLDDGIRKGRPAEFDDKPLLVELEKDPASSECLPL